MARAKLPEVQFSEGVAVLPSEMYLKTGVRLDSEAVANEVTKGDEWTAYGALGRTIRTKHGIIFQARA